MMAREVASRKSIPGDPRWGLSPGSQQAAGELVQPLIESGAQCP